MAHIDGDFIAYQIAADTKDEIAGIRPMRELSYKIGQIEDIANDMMERAGAAKFVLHVTPGASTKGGRPAQVIQKEYQAARSAKDKPEHLDAIRAAIGQGSFKHGMGMVHLDQEADDGMAQANVNDIKNSIIISRDKDLRMVPGYHMDQDDDEIHFVEPDAFGYISLKQMSSSKKLVGYGPAFFWAQCIMGDPVDNIQGLPMAAGFSTQRYIKTGDYDKNLSIMQSKNVTEVAKDRVKAAWVKTKTCGPTGAFEFLNGIDNNKDAFHRVKALFEELGRVAGYKFKHWRTGEEHTPTQALLGDMQALWMRHTKDPNDVVRWLKQFV